MRWRQTPLHPNLLLRAKPGSWQSSWLAILPARARKLQLQRAQRRDVVYLSSLSPSCVSSSLSRRFLKNATGRYEGLSATRVQRRQARQIVAQCVPELRNTGAPGKRDVGLLGWKAQRGISAG